MPEIRHLFVGTFNINAAKLTTFDARKWLADVKDYQPEVVAIGFQECADFPEENSPSPLNFRREYSETWSTSSIAANSTKQQDNENSADEFPEDDVDCHESLRRVLKGYKKVADVAIGEPPIKVVLSGKKTQWYGAIRLLVYFKAAFDPNPEVTTLIIPTGTKKSAVPNWDGYGENSSPDKGAVAVHFPEYDLLLVNLHLNGTNKYGVCEMEFDRKRTEQLGRIHNTLSEKIPHLGETRIVTMGDFNFRIQMLNDQKAKERGGQDFQLAKELAESQDKTKLNSLFNDYDRLHLMLSGKTPKPNAGPVIKVAPRLLEHSHDCLEQMMNRDYSGTDLLVPSFTKVPGEVCPRAFNDKRTPSWPDRILWEGDADEMIVFRIIGDITISDHDPCCALFEFDTHFDKTGNQKSWTLRSIARSLCQCINFMLLALAFSVVFSSLFFSMTLSIVFL